MLKRWVTVTVGLVVVAGVSVLLWREIAAHGLPQDVPAGLALLGLGFFMLSHVIRAVRVAVLAGVPKSKLGTLVRTQFEVNGVNLLLPFKLGEAYRVGAMRGILGGVYRSFTVLLLERILDFSAILLLLLLAWWLAPVLPMTGVPVVVGAGLLVFGIALTCGPLLRHVHEGVFGRREGKFWAVATKTAEKILKIQNDIATLFAQNIGNALGLTVMVWSLEVAAFTMFWHAMGGQVDAFVFLAAAVFLSGLLPGGPAGYGGVQLAFYWVGKLWDLSPGFVTYSVYYNLYIFMPAMAVAGALLALRLITKRS